jgi:hypothetical protein
LAVNRAFVALAFRLHRYSELAAVCWRAAIPKPVAFTAYTSRPDDILPVHSSQAHTVAVLPPPVYGTHADLYGR